MNKIRKAITIVASAAAVAAPMLTLANPAQAAARDGVCDSGEFCYYFNSNEAGSISDFTDSVADYGTSEPSCYDFKGAGNGKGKCIKNNAASAYNHSSKTVRVYFNSNYGGAYQDIAPNTKAQLNSNLYNQNASHQFLTSGGGGGGCSTSGLGDPKTCAQAVAYANAHEGSTSYGSGACDHVAALAYGFPASGSHDAALHWSQVPSAYKHAGSTSVPAGGLAFFTGGSQGYGHVMVSLGGGQFMSTDIGSDGSYSPNHYNKTTINGLLNAFGTVKYVGWAQPWFKYNH